MRYGIDLDGVCFNFIDAFKEYLNHKTDGLLDNKEITTYYWHHSVEGLSEEDFWSNFHKFGRNGGYRNLNLLPGTLDILERLYNDGHQLFYITNRPEYTREDTIAALEKHNFPCKKNLFFALGDKSSLINKLGIKVFVEDSADTIKDIIKKTTAKVYCVDYLSNRHLKHPQVIRIKDWDDFLLEEGL